MRDKPEPKRRLASIGHVLDPERHDAAMLRKRLVLLGWLVASCHVVAVVGVYVLMFATTGITTVVIWSGLMGMLMVSALPCSRSILRRIDAIDDDGRWWSEDDGVPPRQPHDGDDLDWTRFEEQFWAYSRERQLSTSER